VEDDVVVAGCVSDYYPDSKAVEPIYLVVDDTHRNSGIARMLLDTIYKRSGVVDMYVEVDNPELVSESGSSINPKTRVDIYRKLGFTPLDIKYVQPPLDDGMDFEHNLILMYKTKRKPLTKNRIKNFLTSFYKCLGSVDTDEYRELMNDIDAKCHF
jgi:ribosomal protein S18 acetylase RimI-like enzyme